MFLLSSIFPVGFCRPFGVLLASLSPAFPISIGLMLRVVCSWFQCAVLLPVPLLAPHVGHSFQSLNMTQDAAYHEFLDALSSSPRLASFPMWLNVGAVLASDRLSVLVACFASSHDL